MSIRTLLLLIAGLPALIVGAAVALGISIPVPVLGRDYVVRWELMPTGGQVELPEIAGPEDRTRPLIVIDAGHGGRDPGAVGEDEDGRVFLEKEITLAIAMALREELLERGGIRVALTRDGDDTLVLANRPEIARQLEADLFLSIHADSGGEIETVSGASIYTLSNEASSEAAARFAARENDADRLNGISVEGQSDTVSSILVELSQAQTQEDATEFARLIDREGRGKITLHPQSRRSAALAVLRSPDVPSVLFESGFVTNSDDRARLTTEAGRQAFASALADAIQVYFARRSDTSDE
ncbi:N-acetylmuramoyl-L-alanine amidase [Erythrobacter sp. YT30]|uniref:N-acetylmuramoyl-L-alanine amidase family protein n=1 Tax=Erythrobacter sp. YT30 TaxID=1735012 RepID=UPI00076C6660|nr:N-acetylmuramoyl-L-alanine amidase [Erythrobacter sp. YT30]KWV93065.1 N-acetylmuramoyl-L-alanine amidase [Erythrobacter sp. YT30]